MLHFLLRDNELVTFLLFLLKECGVQFIEWVYVGERNFLLLLINSYWNALNVLQMFSFEMWNLNKQIDFHMFGNVDSSFWAWKLTGLPGTDCLVNVLHICIFQRYSVAMGGTVNLFCTGLSFKAVAIYVLLCRKNLKMSQIEEKSNQFWVTETGSFANSTNMSMYHLLLSILSVFP